MEGPLTAKGALLILFFSLILSSLLRYTRGAVVNNLNEGLLLFGSPSIVILLAVIAVHAGGKRENLQPALVGEELQSQLCSIFKFRIEPLTVFTPGTVTHRPFHFFPFSDQTCWKMGSMKQEAGTGIQPDSRLLAFPLHRRSLLWSAAKCWRCCDERPRAQLHGSSGSSGKRRVWLSAPSIPTSLTTSAWPTWASSTDGALAELQDRIQRDGGLW